MSNHGDRDQWKVHAHGKQEILRFYQRNDIKMIGEALPAPFLHYDDLKLNKMFRKFSNLMDKLRDYQELPHPTLVQAQIIPTILSRRNFCAVSKREEDRVLAYLIPAIIYICWLRNRAPIGVGPMLVVIAPTVEMCIQIARLASVFGAFVDVENSMVVDMSPQDALDFFGKPKVEAMRDNVYQSGVDIVIATPKRFLHLLLDNHTNVHRLNCIVFDELDEMFQLGFYSVVDRLMAVMPKNVQMSVFCSTLPLDVRIFNEHYLAETHYVQMMMAGAHLKKTPLQNVVQHVYVIRQKEKAEMLFKVLKGIYQNDESDNKKTVIFVEQSVTVTEPLSQLLKQRNYEVIVIDGSENREEYFHKLALFKEIGNNSILLTNNKKFRGPNFRFSDVKYVINFDFPLTFHPEATYIHQCGRAGLTIEEGESHTFMISTDAHKAQEIIDILKECKQPIDIKLYDLASAFLNSTKIPQKRLTLFDILSDSDVDDSSITARRPSRLASLSPLPIRLRSRSRSLSSLRTRNLSPVRSKKVEPVGPSKQVLKLRAKVEDFYGVKKQLSGESYEHYLPEPLIELLVRNGFKKLTALQSQVFGSALRGRDLLTIAKPSDPDRILSYLVPVIVHIIRNLAKRRRAPDIQCLDADGPMVTIVVPSVEHVDQVHVLAKLFCEPFEITEIAIGTPKNFAEMLKATDNTYLVNCNYLIFDELHEMLDTGYIEELELIHRRCGSARAWQSRLVFSSQFSIYERMFCKDFLNPNHTIVNMMPLTLSNNSFKGVKQVVDIILNEENKRSEMTKFLEKILRNKVFAKNLKVIIFVSKKPAHSFYTKVQSKLPSATPKILNLASDRTDEERSAILKTFHSRSQQILVTKDVQAKEIDLTGVKLIINYEYPSNGKLSEYVYLNRISQSDRKSADRFAISFLTLSDARKARHLTNMLEQMTQTINPLLHDLTTFEDTKINDQTKDLIKKIFDSKPTPTVGNSVALLKYVEEKYPRPAPAKVEEKPKLHKKVLTESPKKMAIVREVSEVSALVSAAKRTHQTQIAITKAVPPTSSKTQHSSTTTTSSVSIESSSHSYHNIPPKLIINNQFINTNMSTFTATNNPFFNPPAPHAAPYKSQPRKQKKSTRTTLNIYGEEVEVEEEEARAPAPPPPPKIDRNMLHALKKASLNLKRSSEQSKAEEERKKYKRGAETRSNLTDSVSAFLEKLTNTYSSSN